MLQVHFDENEEFTFNGGKLPFILTNTNDYSCFENSLERTTTTGMSMALAVDNQGYPVIVYKDSKSNNLRLARANSHDPFSLSNWKVQSVLNTDDVNNGRVLDSITCAIGSDGKLHIAFKNRKNQ